MGSNRKSMCFPPFRGLCLPSFCQGYAWSPNQSSVGGGAYFWLAAHFDSWNCFVLSPPAAQTQERCRPTKHWILGDLYIIFFPVWGKLKVPVESFNLKLFFSFLGARFSLVVSQVSRVLFDRGETRIPPSPGHLVSFLPGPPKLGPPKVSLQSQQRPWADFKFNFKSLSFLVHFAHGPPNFLTGKHAPRGWPPAFTFDHDPGQAPGEYKNTRLM